MKGVKNMGFVSDIVKRLSSQRLGARADAFIIFPIFEKEEEVNCFLRNNPIRFFNLEESLKKINERNKCEKMAILKVSFELVEVIERSQEIELALPDLKNMTIKKRIALENFFAEAHQLIIERKAKDEERPFAPTQYLKEMHEAVIRCDAGRPKEFKDLEEIFAL
jgi:hypothetical protein